MKKISLIILVMLYGALGMSQELDRIGIIGAGPAGLIAAWELKKKGYSQVTVLEAANDVGGKVETVIHDGLPYEMGAVITALDYEIVLGLAKELGISLSPPPRNITCDRDGQLHSMLEWSKQYGWKRIPKLTKSFAKFSYYVLCHDEFFKPGFDHTPTEMNCTFEQFMYQEEMQDVLEAYRPIMVGCGYGFAETMPAAYWMKLMKTFGYEFTKKAFSVRGFYQSFTNGWQELFRKLVADQDLDVRLNSEVIHVERNSDKEPIQVFTQNKMFEFDKLIITVPHRAARFMAFTAEEREIFRMINTLPYKVTLAQIDGLPKKHNIWLRENSYCIDHDGNANDGKPVLISSNQDSNIYQIYQFTESGKEDFELKALMQETIEAMGGKIISIIKEKTFPYFPHFGVEAFQKGIPQKISNLQGKNATYYTGAGLNMETVELSAQHAKTLVDRYF